MYGPDRQQRVVRSSLCAVTVGKENTKSPPVPWAYSSSHAGRDAARCASTRATRSYITLMASSPRRQ